MDKIIRNIDRDEWVESTDTRGASWRYKDFSGEHLGVRVEEISPSGSSSYNHFHTLEEEHVVILSGEAILTVGTEEFILNQGDHICFSAGKEEGHHIENRTDDVCKYLVFGERNKQDVVVYPKLGVMMVKALDNKQFTYRSLKLETTEN